MYRVVIGGVVLLALAGVLQFRQGRQTPDQPLRRELVWDEQGVFAGGKETDLAAVFADWDKRTNLLIVGGELLVLVLAGGTLLYGVALSAVPLVAVPPLVVTYLLGAYFLGQAIYLRLGLDDTAGGPARVRTEALIADRLGNDAEVEFAAMTAALGSARGDVAESAEREAVTALVLAGASSGATAEALQSVAAGGELSATAVDETIETLAKNGLLVAPEPDEPITFADDRLEDATPDQVVAMATAVTS